MDYLIRVVAGIQPVYDFMHELWGAFPLELRLVVALFFGIGISLTIIRNFIL